MNRPTREELRTWITTYLEQLLGLEREAIDPHASFEVLGLDSSGAVGLSGDLEHLLGVEFETSLVYDHPSIAELVEYLASLRLLAAA